MIKQSNMLVITSTWGQLQEETFKLIPIYDNCPYQECIFDPKSKVLAVISKILMKKFVMVPVLDKAGNRIMEFDKKDKNKPIGYAQERKQIDSYQEYYIENIDEIRDFVYRFAANTYDIEKYLVKQEVPPGKITMMSEPGSTGGDTRPADVTAPLHVVKQEAEEEPGYQEDINTEKTNQ